MKLADVQDVLFKQVLRPVHDRPDMLRMFDPLVGVLAGASLVWASGLGFAAFGVLLACAFLAFQILTRVFGVSFDFDPELFQKYASAAATH